MELSTPDYLHYLRIEVYTLLGADLKIIDILRNVKKAFSGYSPSVEILISKTSLLHNLNEYKRQYPNLLFAPVLKSNAYGHGLIEVARVLDKEKKAFFVVDSLYEVMVLRNKGIKSPLLIIGYTSPENIVNCKLPNIAFTITDLNQLQTIAKLLTKRKSIHLKIDTGMHRQGILPDQINEAIDIIRSHKFLYLEGICSHLADADNTDQSLTQSQLSYWDRAVTLFNKNFITIKFIHVLATSGIRNFDKATGNTVRLGIGLYGIGPLAQEDLNLKPVLQMQSIISSIKTIPTGEYIGYGATHKTEHETKVATIPLGYFEGINRRLSNCGVVKIGNIFCPIIGKISMNITSIDMSSVPSAKSGDKVIIISNNADDPNSITNIAELIDTIPYEILVQIPQHLRRRII